MSGERLWQAIAAALFVLWVWSFAWWSFRAELSQTQWLGMFRDDVIKSVQQLAQQQQSLAQQVKALQPGGAEAGAR
jgi:hypothetical protein